jgi:hypothetical protein
MQKIPPPYLEQARRNTFANWAGELFNNTNLQGLGDMQIEAAGQPNWKHWEGRPVNFSRVKSSPLPETCCHARDEATQPPALHIGTAALAAVTASLVPIPFHCRSSLDT